MAATWSRREFGQLVTVAGGAAIAAGRSSDVALAQGVASPGDEREWERVREHFLMPPNLAVMNAANLCPSSRPVIEALERATLDIDRDPSPANRAKLGAARSSVRAAVAAFLRATPEEIVLTRNTSEANNLVSSGVELRAGDEVVLFADNHQSNLQAWREKAKRFGFTVKVVDAVNPHPGAEYYVDAFTRALTPQTKLLALTHLTSTVGDLMPVNELCRVARARGVLTLVDGAQSFGLLDVDLSAMQPDFYTGSAHKWLCGPKEVGVLFVNARAHDRIWPSIYSAYPGDVGISRTFESFGQRDEPALIALEAALDFQTRLGRAAIQQRSSHLATALMTGLQKISGVTVWTSDVPERRAAVVSARVGSLDPGMLAATLYERDRIAVATRGGGDRGGLRFSPHFYNTMAEVERAVAAVARLAASGV